MKHFKESIECYLYSESNEWKYRYSQREHFCSTKMIMSRVKHRYRQNTGGCVPMVEPNVAKQNGSIGCNGRWKGGGRREEAREREMYVCVLCAPRNDGRHRIAPLGNRNTVGMSSKNNASVCFTPSASASSRVTLIGLDLDYSSWLSDLYP